jgi:hypothetical protein
MLTVQYPEVASHMGLMWRRSFSPSLQDSIWNHGGGMAGYLGYVAIAEQDGREFGLTVIMNSGGVPAATAIVSALFQNILANLDDCESGGTNVAVAEVPSSLQLHPIHPNPFNPQTTISFSLPRTEGVEIGIYDLTGRRLTVLAHRSFAAGTHALSWNGRDSRGHSMASGTYFVRLVTASEVSTRKVMLIR